MQQYEGNKRLFLALWPDDDVRYQLADLLPNGHGRPVKAENLHITLVFLGDTPWHTAEQLIQRIDRLHPRGFHLTVSHTGWWKHNGIFWAGLREIPEELRSLVKSLRKRAKEQGIKTDTRSYHPHVTLARKVREKIKTRDDLDIQWPVDQFVLVESVPIEGGVEYHVLQTWKLKT